MVSLSRAHRSLTVPLGGVRRAWSARAGRERRAHAIEQRAREGSDWDGLGSRIRDRMAPWGKNAKPGHPPPAAFAPAPSARAYVTRRVAEARGRHIPSTQAAGRRTDAGAGF